MQISLCNEVLANMTLPQQCECAARLGYDGLEIAPFTLSDSPHEIPGAGVARIRATVESFGLVVTGLHWLLVKPSDLSLTDPDPVVRARTLDVMQRLCNLCAELGGKVMVHGSPGQRLIADGQTHASSLAFLQEALDKVADAAAKAGVLYCIEPLSKTETPLINTLAEAVDLVKAINHPHLRTMLDCSAAGLSETQTIPELLDQWLPTGLVSHLQVNDPNRCGPGQGEMRFAPILAALKRNQYAGGLAVQPFDYVPDGMGAAAYSIGYLRGLLEAQA